MPSFDLVVLGAGTSGLAAARAAVGAGRRVALVEAARPGGDCTFTGCVPSKTLLETARRVQAARSGAAYGFRADVEVDFAAVMRRVHATIESVWQDESNDQLAREGIEVVTGHARFTSPEVVETDAGEQLRAERFVVAVGSRAAVPDVPGLAALAPLTNEDVFDLTELPAHLLVLGGGPIGCELAQAFRRLGSQVTLVQSGPRLLPKDDAEAAAVVRAALEREGVVVHTSVQVTAAAPGPVLTLADGRELRGSHLLVAAGRAARTDGAGLDAAGVELEDNGRVAVDEHLRTSAPHVWAAGDCASPWQFTHAGDEMGRLAARNAFARRPSSFDTRVMPWTTFTEPEVAQVGLTEAQAHERYGERARVAVVPMTRTDRARCAGETDGFVKLIAAPRNAVVSSRLLFELVGMTAVCPVAGELVAEGALSMHTRGLVGRMAQTVHAYPTWGLSVRIAAATLFGAGGDAGQLRPARA